ncbi:TetR/AcrR family transcriptional regulator [Nocardia sp. CDC159]|uniref:TetR/AcrR family transcriptional regulator n=1 Tax=Nocardia pulmonis TaxID=2951408 RepID=A0A9X2E4G5_9NOCA|nr:MULTISPECIES: TetR/AcrR family transcriptional regulator [Nocardia]MCM6773451.1 TetR/AcrR family transcriptional regulator [Nocardia pulmonis]MCM6786338.1 TetR/AcrR family transcriptional regulator [Nocardia sp. CDC159]
MSTPTPGLRAMKKQQTRDNISNQATRLFLERGFDRVTIAEVAAAAQVAKMTVTNYFPRKEDLALDMHDLFVGQPAATVRDRKPGESALAAVRRAFLAAAAAHDPVIGFSGPEFARMITDSPALVARLREFHDDREKSLAAVLAEETGAAPDDIAPRVAAVQLCGVLRLLFEETLRRTLDGHADAEIERAVTAQAHTAFGALEPALGGYAIRPVR